MAVLFTFNRQTKFEMSSFIRSIGMAWAQKYRNGSRDPDNAHKANTLRSQLMYEIWSL